MKSSILHLHTMLEKREISSLELTEKYLQNIEKWDGEINSYITVARNEALSMAKRADEIISGNDFFPLLCGIPAALKDNISTKGIETTCASKMLKGYKPFYDAHVTECILGDGGVILGKTNMDEFAMGSFGDTSFFGQTKNPYDLNKVAGGSSGGGAASVCAGMAAYSLGSDTGGSVRQPASFCDVVGFKPSYGAVSRYGLISYASGFDQIGIISKSVTDASIVYNSISAGDKRDSTFSEERIRINLESLDKGIKGLKIGYLSKGLTEEARESLSKALSVFSSEGAEIIEIEEINTDHILSVYYTLVCAEASSNLGRYDGIRFGYRAKNYKDAEDMVKKSRGEAFGKEVKKRILYGTYALSDGELYEKAGLLRRRFIREIDEVLEKVDLILTPTTMEGAASINIKERNINALKYSDAFTVMANMAYLPAVSVPFSFDRLGMPMGIQIMGRRFRDDLVLRAGRMIEECRPPILEKSFYGGDVFGL